MPAPARPSPVDLTDRLPERMESNRSYLRDTGPPPSEQRPQKRSRPSLGGKKHTKKRVKKSSKKKLGYKLINTRKHK
jgi:hypothetical protein